MINSISNNNIQRNYLKKDISMTSNLPKTVLKEAVKVAEETPKSGITARKKMIMNFRKVTDWLLDYKTKHVYDKEGNLSEIIHTTDWGRNKKITSYKNGEKIGSERRWVRVDNANKETILGQTFYNKNGMCTKKISHHDDAPIKIYGRTIIKTEINFTKTYGKNNDLYKLKLTDINGKKHSEFLDLETARMYWI